MTRGLVIDGSDHILNVGHLSRPAVNPPQDKKSLWQRVLRWWKGR